jgi:ribulose-phosphate 3-epimerase
MTASIEIVPAILVNSQAEFEKRLKLIENEVETVQVDILDGSKFDSTSWFDAEAVATYKTPVQFELHLMVENPLPIIDAWAKHVPNTVRAIIHAELDRPLGSLIELIHQNSKLEAGISLNPETPIDEIHHVIHQIDEILVMGVHPGASGQGLGDSKCGISGQAILAKLERIHDRYPEIILGVDGGADLTTIPEFMRHGCSRISVGSAVFNADNPVDALHKLQELAKKTV